MRRSHTIVGAYVILFILTGCLRYTPSHSELIEKQQNGADENVKFGGKEEFQRHEEILKKRLDIFLAERSPLKTLSSSADGFALQVGDSIAVTVFGFNNLTTKAVISDDGSVQLPLIGPVRISGAPPLVAQNTIQARYAQFIKAPKVQLNVENQRSMNVSVLGEVHRPGPYPLARTGSSLTELLSEAGVRTPQAGTRILLLPSQRSKIPFDSATVNVASSDSTANLNRIADGVVEIDFEQLTGTTSTPPLHVPLRPGDTIIIPEAGTYEVDGEVGQPGSYKLTSRTSIMGAIAAARGLTYAASVNSVELIRDVGGGEKALISMDLEAVGLRGARDIRLRNGDLVRVPSEPSRFFKRQVVHAINGLFNGVGVNQRLN